MGEFKAGDTVLVNRALVATLVSYDPENDRVVFEAKVGGGTNRTTAHITQTTIEVLPVPADTYHEESGTFIASEQPSVAESNDGTPNRGA